MSGWYPDPTGRFEYRFHNDQHWTSDVATDGRRYVDPLPAPSSSPGGPVPTPPQETRGNGIAVASMVCGIVAVVIAWVPFVGIAGLITAIVGLALSVPALRRSTRTGRRRGVAIAGLVTSGVGLVLGVLGIALTVYLVRAIDRFEQPGPFAVTITSCADDGPELVATGEITNESTSERDYTVRVELGPRNSEWVAVDDVPAGGTADFTARDVGSFSDGACDVIEVNGPVPFGLDPSIFEE